MSTLQGARLIETLRQLEVLLRALNGILSSSAEGDKTAPASTGSGRDSSPSRDRRTGRLDRYLPANGSAARRLRSSLMVADVMASFNGAPTTRRAFLDAFFKAFPKDSLSEYWSNPSLNVNSAFQRLIAEGTIRKVDRHHFVLSAGQAPAGVIPQSLQGGAA